MKDKTTAGLLALFLGGIGIHWFYLGNNKKGLIYIALALFTFGTIPVLLALYDGIVLLTMSNDVFQAKYGQGEPFGGALASAPAKPVDTAKQIADFAALRDSGAITAEEYEKKKADLLG